MAALFTQRHYEWLARFIKYELELARQLSAAGVTADNRSDGNSRAHTIEGMARLLAQRLARDDDGFDRDRFLKACGER